MNIELIKLKEDTDLKRLFFDCQGIVDENLVQNGGNLKQNDLINKDFAWSHLVLLKNNDLVIGFALVRRSKEDKHKTGFEEYYYISQIAIKKDYQNRKLGTVMLNFILENITDLPLVASVSKGNVASLALFNKGFTQYSETGNYFRYINNNAYELKVKNELN